MGVPNPFARLSASSRHDHRIQLALVRETERRAVEQASSLADRVRELESELEEQYCNALEIGAATKKAGSSSTPRHVQREIAELREMFRSIQERSTAPALATIVIPAYEKLDYTLRCLRSIAQNWSELVNPVIVVVDDASPDGSGQSLLGIPGVDVLSNGKNLGYLRSTNRGSLLARTKYVCLLNNDTEVRSRWLDKLVQRAENDSSIGAVGSKLIYPDGSLQEAGSIIWSDASGWNYGRGGDPNDSRYNFARTVDYCSAASLLVRTDLLRDLGGFDERYVPAYYEDADLCFALAFRGYRVVYEPMSEVVHHEGVSSGTDISSGVKRYQEVNRTKFADKWRAVLTEKLPPSADNVERAVHGDGAKTVLVIDTYVPLHDREAGSNRLFKIVQALREMRYRVVFFPDNGAPVEPYSSDLVALGVEVLYASESSQLPEKVLADVLQRVDVAWICRPELCRRYIPVVRESAAGVPVIYDTIDLHFAREKRRIELEGGDEHVWQSLRETELAMAAAADIVITVTEAERQQLKECGVENVAVIPTIHDLEEHSPSDFSMRDGIVFIGGYGHPPNVDAVQWLCREVMPIVWHSVPDMHVTLLGNRPPPEVNALRSTTVSVTGFIPDVRPYFDEARLFVAPLRYGAGMKGKVGHALSLGLPVVATSVAIEGYELVDGDNALVADDAPGFARAILRLYRDPVLWQQLSKRGEESIRELSLEAVGGRLQTIIGSMLERTS